MTMEEVTVNTITHEFRNPRVDGVGASSTLLALLLTIPFSPSISPFCSAENSDPTGVIGSNVRLDIVKWEGG
jgi:hypothetical protein